MLEAILGVYLQVIPFRIRASLGNHCLRETKTTSGNYGRFDHVNFGVYPRDRFRAEH